MTTELDLPPSPTDPTAAERQALIARWAERHGVDAARRLAEAEDLADAVAAEITPDNTVDTYGKSWRVWERFCAAAGLPQLEGSRGALVAFVTWMLREGQRNGQGYAATSASTHLAAAVVGLRQRGVKVSGDDQAEARAALEGLAVKLLQAGERRGRGQAASGDIDGLRDIARACPDTLSGDRDKALMLTGFHYASRSQDPAGLLTGDVTLHPRGLVVAVLTGKTKHSVRNAKIRYADDPEICPVRAWAAYRTRLVAEHGPQWTTPLLRLSSASTDGVTSPAAWCPTPSPAPSSGSRSGPGCRSPGPGTPCASAWPPSPAVPAVTALPLPTRAAGPATPARCSATCNATTAGTTTPPPASPDAAVPAPAGPVRPSGPAGADACPRPSPAGPPVRPVRPDRANRASSGGAGGRVQREHLPCVESADSRRRPGLAFPI